MQSFIKKYYVLLVIIVSVTSFALYQSLFLINTFNTITNDTKYNAFASGPSVVSVFMGSVGDKGKCDTMIQVKRGIQPGNLLDGALKKLFEGPIYSEETVIESAFKGYGDIYGGTKVVGTTAFIDFKYDLIDPNSKYFKDFTKSCAVAQLNQLIFTAKQFQEIQNVVISIDKSPRKFMQARQINCDLEKNKTKFENECLTTVP